jgi:protein required for attachment to host cells
MKTWIVVAHRGGARLVDEVDEALRVFETLVAATHSQPERAPESHHGNNEARDSARDHAAAMFATELAERLRKGRNGNHYDELVLIAAPRFLGLLRDALDGATTTLVRGTLDKDYASLSDRDLLSRLEKM